MTFDEYQQRALSTDLGKDNADKSPMSPAFLSAILGLAGESGEFTDKFKKVIRDDKGIISDERQAELKKELGDVLWYVAVVADYLGIPLSELATANIEKLADRAKRQMLAGSGDNR